MSEGLVLYSSFKTSCHRRVFYIKYPFQMKLKAVKQYEENRTYLMSEVSLGKQFKILSINPGTLYTWLKKYRDKGLDGLKCLKRGEA